MKNMRVRPVFRQVEQKQTLATLQSLMMRREKNESDASSISEDLRGLSSGSRDQRYRSSAPGEGSRKRKWTNYYLASGRRMHRVQ
jgi:hypothetical protein